VSTYVLMRILESAPRRYELGMRLLTFGRVERAYDRLAGCVTEGQRVLDLGCGPGALALRAARRGARVKAIDVNPEMLEIASDRLTRSGVAANVSLVEMGVAELDREAAGSYDVVMSGLCFSELSEDERRYALAQAARILRPGGRLLLADEVVPRGRMRRLLHALLRAPLAAIAYLVTQQTTHAIANLPEQVEAAGFSIEGVRSDALGSFLELMAEKPPRAS